MDFEEEPRLRLARVLRTRCAIHAFFCKPCAETLQPCCRVRAELPIARRQEMREARQGASSTRESLRGPVRKKRGDHVTLTVLSEIPTTYSMSIS